MFDAVLPRTRWHTEQLPVCRVPVCSLFLGVSLLTVTLCPRFHWCYSHVYVTVCWCVCVCACVWCVCVCAWVSETQTSYAKVYYFWETNDQLVLFFFFWGGGNQSKCLPTVHCTINNIHDYNVSRHQQTAILTGPMVLRGVVLTVSPVSNLAHTKL